MFYQESVCLAPRLNKLINNREKFQWFIYLQSALNLYIAMAIDCSTLFSIKHTT